MCGRSSPLLIVATALAFLGTAVASAQPIERYRNFEYDTLFRIGAHTVPGYASFARDTLKLDFTYHYQPTHDNRGVGVLASRIQNPQSIFDSLDRDLYVQAGVADSLALRTTFCPDVLKVMGGFLAATDSYPYHNPELQVLPFELVYGQLEPFEAGADATMLKTVSLPIATVGPLVKQPRYVSKFGFQRSDSLRYCDPEAYPYYNIGNDSARLGYDSSYKVRFSFHMQAEENDSLTSATVIAQVYLWRRLTTGTARCAIY